MIKWIYRAVVPEKIRKAINIPRVKKKTKILWLQFREFFKNNPESKLKYEKEIRFFEQRNQFQIFPYEFTLKYNPENVIVQKDINNGLHYVMHCGKRLYFPRKMPREEIQKKYNNLMIEQDAESPHRYLTEAFGIDKGMILADVGCAEGMLSLEVIELTKKVYLFEYKKEWVDALNATFMQWKDKVTIVQKYVSDTRSNNTTTIDNFFKDSHDSLLIKMDVEGAESKVLSGGNETLKGKNVKVICCTYHKQNDAEEFQQLLNSKGYKTEFTDGYMFWKSDKSFKPPYFRKGLIRGWKV
ncbi:MAG: FkbM family methyltransferase [Eubacteriales bacterium]|nr:FkbM family methyltransferase [Eubacteriales bacterium]